MGTSHIHVRFILLNFKITAVISRPFTGSQKGVAAGQWIIEWQLPRSPLTGPYLGRLANKVCRKDIVRLTCLPLFQFRVLRLIQTDGWGYCRSWWMLFKQSSVSHFRAGNERPMTDGGHARMFYLWSALRAWCESVCVKCVQVKCVVFSSMTSDLLLFFPFNGYQLSSDTLRTLPFGLSN